MISALSAVFYDQALIETDESEDSDWFRDPRDKVEEDLISVRQESILLDRAVSQADLPKQARLSKEKCERIHAEVLQAIQSGSIKAQRNYRQRAGMASREELRAFVALEGIDPVLQSDVNKLLRQRERENRNMIQRTENRKRSGDIEKPKRDRLYSLVSSELGKKHGVPNIADLQTFLAKDGIDSSVRKGVQSLLRRKEKDLERHQKRRKIETSK